MNSLFSDLFSSGVSVWFKIAGAAVFAPLLVLGCIARLAGQGNDRFTNPAILIAILTGSMIAGALMGVGLCMHDVVKKRIEAGKPVNAILKLFFAGGIITLFVWIPFFIVALVIVLNVLGL